MTWDVEQALSPCSLEGGQCYCSPVWDIQFLVVLFFRWRMSSLLHGLFPAFKPLLACDWGGGRGGPVQLQAWGAGTGPY